MPTDRGFSDRIARTTVALAMAAVAAVVNGLLWPEFGNRYPLIGFYPAIVLTALRYGAGPGIVCTIASSVIAAYVWLGPRSSITVSRAADAVALTVFVTIGAVLSLLTDISARRAAREHAARRRAERAEREVADELADVKRLQHLTVTVFRRQDPAMIVGDLLQASVELVDAVAAQVYLIDPNQNVLRLAAHVGLPRHVVDDLTLVADDGGPIAEAFTQRRLVVKGSDGQATVSHDRLHAFPMITADQKVLGVLATYRSQNHVSGRREHFLDASVQQAAQAIERCRLLEGERLARGAAEEASRLKDSFLSTVSHELRTPLNAVLGWADMLRSGRLSDAARKRALSAISVNAQRQMQLIAELLDVSRITSGTLRIQTADVDVADVVRKAVDVVEPAALAKNLQLKVEADASMCRADPGRLQQVVWNLLTNAIKFTPTRGTVDVSVGRRNGSVEIRVRDTGSGIRASFLPYVFEPFRQADDSTTRREGGLGLGLSIVKHLVEAHGGAITADSAGDGLGSCFTVRLPASGTTPPLCPAASDDEAESRQPTLTGLSVLVVEDDPDSRELLAVALEGAGAKVHVSASARGALESLLHRPVDVVVADIAMPEEDGYAFIRRVRASPSPAIARVRAIALTSLAQEQDRRDAVEAGFQVHLTKPIKPAALADAVARVVHQPAIR